MLRRVHVLSRRVSFTHLLLHAHPHVGAVDDESYRNGLINRARPPAIITSCIKADLKHTVPPTRQPKYLGGKKSLRAVRIFGAISILQYLRKASVTP